MHSREVLPMWWVNDLTDKPMTRVGGIRGARRINGVRGCSVCGSRDTDGAMVLASCPLIQGGIKVKRESRNQRQSP